MTETLISFATHLRSTETSLHSHLHFPCCFGFVSGSAMALEMLETPSAGRLRAQRHTKYPDKNRANGLKSSGQTIIRKKNKLKTGK